jgi:hypothetical protein
MALILSGTDGLSDVDGSAATPAIRGTDSNTGIFFPAADTIAFAEGGAEVARFDSAGNLGIGTSSPASALYVRRNSGNAGIYADYNGTNVGRLEAASNGNLYVGTTTGTGSLLLGTTANAAAVELTNSGNLGLGVTPSAWTSGGNFDLGAAKSLSASNSIVSLGANYFFGSGGFTYKTAGNATSYSQALGMHRWLTAPSGTAGNAVSFTIAMMLDTSGNLLVGATSTSQSHRLVGKTNDAWTTEFFSPNASPFGIDISYTATSPNNTSAQFVRGIDTFQTRFEIRSNGGIANFSGNNVNLSDRREKTNFAPAKSYLETICAIPVQTFNYIDQNMEDDPGLTLGVVAQDVKAVAPELVMESNWAGKDEEPKMRLSIYQTDLQYALMKCIQEQQVLIQEIKAELAALKGEA